MQEQIKGKNYVFNRFSCGQLRVADVLTPPFSLIWLSIPIFWSHETRMCTRVCVIAAVNREQREDDGK